MASPLIRNNPFARASSQSPGPRTQNERPKSVVISSPPTTNPTQSSAHNRNQSTPSLAGVLVTNNNDITHNRSSSKASIPGPGTFAPSFIKTEEMQRGSELVKGIEGENDFSGKRYVWLKDPEAAFVRGWIVEDLAGNQILVQCDDGSVSSNLDFQPPANIVCSNEKSALIAWTKSILQNSTRQTTWLS